MLPDVAQVKPEVQGSSKGVQVTLNVETAPGIDALQKSNQIRQTAQRVLEEKLGLTVGREIRVVLKPSSFPKLAAGAQMPPVVADAIASTSAPEVTAPEVIAPEVTTPEAAAPEVAAPATDWSMPASTAAPMDVEAAVEDTPEEEDKEGEGEGESDALEAKAPPDEG
jgi:hypothetical protein